MISPDEIIQVKDVPVAEWLKLIRSEKVNRVFPPKCFPTDAHCEEYLATVADRTEEEVKSLLRYFLIRSGNCQCDAFHRAFLLKTGKRDGRGFRRLMGFEHNRRLIGEEPTWEGNTWVLDLLPHWPRTAIDALWAYFMAHAQFLPDYWLHGHEDAIAVIRGRFVEYPHPREIFFELTPRQFECLICSLYQEIGYTTELTPPGKDGGRDIIATSNEAARRETVYIECKRWESNVGRPVLQKLFGTVQAHHASRGVLVCSSGFTGPAKEFADDIASLETVNADTLIGLLNQFLGTTWPLHIERHARQDDLRHLNEV